MPPFPSRTDSQDLDAEGIPPRPAGPVREQDFVDRLLDTLEALAIVLDTNGHIVRFNQKCQEVTGYSAAEVQGEHVADLLVPPDEQERVRTGCEELSRGASSHQSENHWQTKEGERRRIRWSNTVFRDIGEVTRVVGTGIDVTRRRTLERKVGTATDVERRRIADENGTLVRCIVPLEGPAGAPS